jgi:hypothetical protein
MTCSVFGVECGARTAHSADRQNVVAENLGLRALTSTDLVYRLLTRYEWGIIAGRKWKLVYEFIPDIIPHGRRTSSATYIQKRTSLTGCPRVECGARTHDSVNLKVKNVTC